MAEPEAAIGKSPFLPPAAATDTAPTADATLELRGIMASGDSYMFSIYDSTHKSSSWARLNENGHGFVVRSHDATRDSVTVDYQGRTLTLALRTAKVASAPVNIPQPAPSPNAAAPGPQPIGGPVVLNPSPADEQRRLEAIAAEVNRRRMIRQQALQASRQANGQQNQMNQPGGTNNPSRLPPGVNNQQR
ncbi:MAG: hypothetical protein ABIV50_08765 [Opitutus sp.]